MEAAEAVKAALEGELDDELYRQLGELLKTDAVEWIWDPQHHNVAGLVVKDTMRAAMVVYLNDDEPDFEVGELFFKLLDKEGLL